MSSEDVNAASVGLRGALGLLLGPEHRFTENDVRLLCEGGYATLEDLKIARRDGLRDANLKPARVDEILHAQGAAARLGSGSTAAGDVTADVQATIKARAPCSSKHAAHLVVPATPPHKEAATVVGQHHVATFAHTTHSEWQIGQKMQVAVHCPTEERRVFTDAVVVYKNPVKDVAVLEVERNLAPPVLDFGISAGDMYYIHGQSTQAQADATSISHGMVAATEPDAECHIRGDIVAGVGDSGGGCFSVATGKLIAMVVGSQAETNKAILVPAAIIASILQDIRSVSKASRAAA